MPCSKDFYKSMETNVWRNDESSQSTEINTSSDDEPFQAEVTDFITGIDSRNNFL